MLSRQDWDYYVGETVELPLSERGYKEKVVHITLRRLYTTCHKCEGAIYSPDTGVFMCTVFNENLIEDLEEEPAIGAQRTFFACSACTALFEYSYRTCVTCEGFDYKNPTACKRCSNCNDPHLFWQYRERKQDGR